MAHMIGGRVTRFNAKGRRSVPAFAPNQAFRAERDTTYPETGGRNYSGLCRFCFRGAGRSGRVAGRIKAGASEKTGTVLAILGRVQSLFSTI
jgi:ribosomal protein S14